MNTNLVSFLVIFQISQIQMLLQNRKLLQQKHGAKMK